MADPVIYAENSNIGIDVTIEDGVQIGFPDKPIKNLVIGDHVFIGHNSRLYSPNLTLLDYTKLHNNALIYGRHDCHIGYNCWFGQGCILDCEGGIYLGNGVGVGADSKIWSHIRHGDVMIGNKYLNFGLTTLEDDVWCVGNTTVAGPLTMKKKSMLFVGSVLTKSTEENTTWGGAPAKDITDKVGRPFDVDPTYEQRLSWFNSKLKEFFQIHRNFIPSLDYSPIIPVERFSDNYLFYNIEFNLMTREYQKSNRPIEIAFMKFLLPEAKFVPRKETV